MKIDFQPLATVTPIHDYYSQGCQDIEFIPTSATADLLRAGRSIARMRDGALYLYYENEGSNTPLSSLAGSTLYFGLRLNNPYFVNFTAPVIASTTLTPFYTNTAQVDALDAPFGITLVSSLYAHTPIEAGRPLDVVLKTTNGQALLTQMLQSGEDHASFDFRHLPDDRYFFDEVQSGSVLQHHPILADSDLRDYGVWGVLALKIDASFYATPPKLTLHFAPRQEKLRYYVIAEKFQQTEFDQLNVNDGDNVIAFDRILPAFPNNQGYLDKELLAPGSTLIAVFQSQTNVERRERGQRKLRLSRNNTVLIEHLPLPGPEKARADLIVHLSKP